LRFNLPQPDVSLNRAAPQHAVREASAEIVDEPHGAFAIAATNKIRHYQFCIGFNRRPSPSVAGAIGRGLRGRNVLLLGVGEAPNFVDLYALGLHVAHVGVVIGRARLPSVDKEFRDRVLARARKARDGADRLAFAEKVKDAGALFCGQLVHEFKMTYFSDLVKHIGHFKSRIDSAAPFILCYLAVMRRMAGGPMKLPIGITSGFLNPGTMSEDDWRVLREECEQVFTPGTPIKESDLFAGRAEQILKLTQRIRSPGSHAVVFGERGVGKSSLVNVFRFIADKNPNKIQYIRIAGVSEDSFTSLFMKVFKRVSVDGTRVSEGYEGKTITSDDVLLEIQNFSDNSTPVIVIDEFDKIKSHSVKQEVSETIKLVSDERANVTFFVVGIADSVAELIEGHESIGRAMAQVEMPRMNDQEIISVIHPRIKRLGFRITEDALWECVFISKGLPFYAHLIGLHATQVCCDKKKSTINSEQIKEAQSRAIDDSKGSISSAFDDATRSERKDNIFLPVLTACALVKKDMGGKFLAKDVANVLSDIMNQSYDVPAFSYHLDQFTTPERGNLLEKIGISRQFRFRFKEALSEPYVILKGRESGIISYEIEKKYGPTRQPDLFSIL